MKLMKGVDPDFVYHQNVFPLLSSKDKPPRDITNHKAKQLALETHNEIGLNCSQPRQAKTKKLILSSSLCDIAQKLADFRQFKLRTGRPDNKVPGVDPRSYIKQVVSKKQSTKGEAIVKVVQENYPQILTVRLSNELIS